MYAVRLLIVSLCVALLCVPASAQERRKEKEEKTKPLPNDPELLALHREFVKDAEKLAVRYEKEKDWSKAKACYEEILKLVPQYPPAKQRVQDLLQLEASAQNTIVIVKANERWQDTGITVIEDKPLTVRVSGTWKFHLSAEVGPQGLAIPKELREFDPGCLVGMIMAGPNDMEKKPFMVGGEKQFLAPKSGRLFLQMYDNDVTDNEGELTVEIQGTYQVDPSKATAKPKEKGK